MGVEELKFVDTKESKVTGGGGRRIWRFEEEIIEHDFSLISKVLFLLYFIIVF